MNGGDGMSGEGDVWLTEALIAAGSIRAAGKSGLVVVRRFIAWYLISSLVAAPDPTWTVTPRR